MEGRQRRESYQPDRKTPWTPLVCGVISINHPGYLKDDARILNLLGYGSARGSIDWNVVFTACAILADNRFDGRLSKSHDPNYPALEERPLLDAGDYWFHVPGPPTEGATNGAYRYPIVSSFRAWRFPKDPPLVWRTGPGGASCAGIEQKCIFTNEGLFTRSCHIVPASETRWFLDNLNGTPFGPRSARRKTGLDQSIDHATNQINLRPDIHEIWDRKDLTFVPKKYETKGIKANGSEIMAHCFEDTTDLIELCHNRPLQDQNVSRELLLARFAWSLVPSGTNLFLSKNVERLLIVPGPDGKPEQKLCSKQDCEDLFLGYGAEGTSFRKRRKSTSSDDEASPDADQEEGKSKEERGSDTDDSDGSDKFRLNRKHNKRTRQSSFDSRMKYRTKSRALQIDG